jgi:hypothetical protein
MNRFRSMYVFSIMVTTLFLSCAQNSADEIDFGTVQDSVYRSEYFGLTVTMPADWSLQDQETLKALSETGGRVLAGDDKNLAAMIKASELKSVHLFAAFKHPVGSPVLFNPSISCVAERVAHLPGIDEGADYLYHTRRLLQAGQMEYIFPSEISEASLGGFGFGLLSSELSMAGTTIRQDFYSRVMKGYALSIIVSYTTDEEYSTLRNVLDSVSFD